MTMHRRSVVLAAACAAICAAGAAMAQDASDGTADPSADQPTTGRGSRFEVVEEVVVSGVREASYTGNVTTATLLPLSLENTGMSLTVLNESLLKDIAVTTLQDALSAAGSGVANSPNAQTGFTPRMRGFEATVLRNGHRFRRQNFDTYNVDSLEVARGSFGALYGVTDPGGVINVVTMAPDFKRRLDFTARVGNNETYRGQLNANLPLFDNALVLKLDAVHDEKEGDIDNWFTKVEGVNPGARLGLFDDRLVVKAEYEYLKNKQTAPGQYIAINLNPARDTAIGYDRTNRGLGLYWNTYGPDSFFERKSEFWFAEASFRIIDNISLRYSYANASFNNRQAVLAPGPNGLGVANYRTAEFYSAGQNIFPYYDGTDLNLGSSDTGYPSGVFNRSKKVDLVADWDLSPSSTLTTLIGWEQFNEATPFCVIARGPALGNQTTLSPDVFESIHFDNSPATAPFNRIACVDPANQFQAYRGSVVFSGWDERLNLVAGARRDYDPQQRDGFRIILGANTDGTPFQAAGLGVNEFRPEDKTTYQISALFKATPQISPFVNYSTSFRPQTSRIIPAGAGGIFRPDPLEGEGMDLGVKLKLGAFDATFAYFDITLKNRPSSAADLSGGLSAFAGRENVRGVDVQFTYQPTASLLFLGNAAFIDSEVEVFATARVNEAGEDIVGAPKTSGFLLAQYSFPQNLQVQASVEYRGSYRTSASSDSVDYTGLRSDAVTLVGARIAYPFMLGDTRTEVALVGRNLLDKLYIVDDGSLTEPRQILAEMSVSF